MGRFDEMRKMVQRGAVLSLALVVAACSSGERPWWDGGSSGRSPSPVSRPVETMHPGGTYVVKRGDTVYSIARAHNVPVRSVIDANRLAAPYKIEVGQRLTIPAGRFHIVQRGDTVSGISRQYNVGVAALTSLNRIPPPYTIKVGERLQIPASQHQSQTASSSPAQGGTGVPLARPAAGAAVASLPPPTASTPTVPRDPLPAPPVATGGFQWPIQGKILSTFGPKANGLHNDGINIAAEMGAPVKASQSGVVAYAGNELKGYGNLLLIRHDNGWVTAYAHNSKLLVSRGDTVMRGQTIAHAGNTGSVVTPQVHFEVRQGAKAIDPQSVIGM
ncbi:peptidoglycan DD-metalloendopeptidase family protein [Parvibaculum sp.]|uniref:peptidoglycan DD-metalloendopeptidase family protein n=1 Tax=Parvibaculum sp. TaxID=2024848 RepID=UPI00391B2CBC